MPVFFSIRGGKLHLESRDLLERECAHIGGLLSMFDGYGDDIAVRIQIDESLLVDIHRIDHQAVGQFNVDCIGITEIANLHSLGFPESTVKKRIVYGLAIS